MCNGTAVGWRMKPRLKGLADAPPQNPPARGAAFRADGSHGSAWKSTNVSDMGMTRQLHWQRWENER